LVAEFGFLLEQVIREFLQYLYINLSEIPFTISLGAAGLLTIMYVASFISSAIIRILLIPTWIFVVLTYFFPSSIPQEYEFFSLVIFAAMIGITILLLRSYRKKKGRTRTDKAVSDILTWMKAESILNPNKPVEYQSIQNKIEMILKRNRIL